MYPRVNRAKIDIDVCAEPIYCDQYQSKYEIPLGFEAVEKKYTALNDYCVRKYIF